MDGVRFELLLRQTCFSRQHCNWLCTLDMLLRQARSANVVLFPAMLATCLAHKACTHAHTLRQKMHRLMMSVG
jgi:hypothetical protein